MSESHMRPGRRSPQLTDRWDKLIRDLPPECLADIGLKLSTHVGKNYKDLAGRLNFTADDVERLSREHPSNPGELLLREWSQRENTTARVLKENLNELGRSDVKRMLELALDEPVRLVVVVKDEEGKGNLFDGIIKSFGQEKIIDALKADEYTAKLLPVRSKQKGVLDERACKLKGQQITFYKSRSEEDTCSDDFPSHFSPSNSNPKLDAYPEDVGSNNLRTRRHAETTVDVRLAEHRTRPRPEGEYDRRSPSSGSAEIQHSRQLSGETSISQTIPKERSPVSPPMQQQILTPTKYTPYESESETLPKQFYSQVNSLPEQSTYSQASMPPSTSPPRRPPRVATVKPEKHVFSDNQYLQLVSSINKNPTTSSTLSKTTHSHSSTDSRPSLDLKSDGDSDYLTTDFNSRVQIDIPGFHESATNNNIIHHIFMPMTHVEGAYIIRPSREDPNARCISVIFEQGIVNYRIHTRSNLINNEYKIQYYLFENKPEFESIRDLVDFHKTHQIKSDDEPNGPLLKKPVL